MVSNQSAISFLVSPGLNKKKGTLVSCHNPFLCYGLSSKQNLGQKSTCYLVIKVK